MRLPRPRVGGEQQVHVVVHQYPAMQAATGMVQGVGQQVQVSAPVHIVQEAGQAVGAALHDVLRDTGQVEAGLSGHALSVSKPQRFLDPPMP